MNLSNTCKAAIKSVIYLASQYSSDNNATIKTIATAVGENEHTIGKLLQTLVKQGIIKSSKGPSGGFYLSETQYIAPIINVVWAIDGRNTFNKCGLGLSECSSSHPCPIHHEYKEARDIMERIFKNRKISEMSLSFEHGQSFLNA